jgi:hypothetical protein
MRVRITRPWRLRDFPFASLAVGKVFEVRSSVAAYLFAMRCAEPAPAGAPASRLSWTRRNRRKSLGGTGWEEQAHPRGIWRFLSERSIAETRIRIAGRWHRLRLELDAAVMDQCSFYVEGRGAAV